MNRTRRTTELKNHFALPWLQEIAQLPIQVKDVDMELAQAAARLKAQHNLPYADCFAAALAQARKAALVTSDRGFQRVRPALKILWV